ncbi:MAG: polyprenyl diphosphate synthase [Gemmatimonadales bacterium]
MQSSFHVAIIMDGNGRWATERRRPRTEGHRAGVRAVRRAVRAAPLAGIDLLTLYAFSADNWRRPPSEVEALMRLFERFLRGETAACVENGIRLNVIGRRDRLSPALRRAIDSAEAATAAGTRLLLRVAVDYSSRESILRAAGLPAADAGNIDGFAAALARVIHAVDQGRPVDLLIRTGRERRLSDFLLWECAYAELYFSDRLWPDFTEQDLRCAVDEFRRRSRRFGGLEGVAAG